MNKALIFIARCYFDFDGWNWQANVFKAVDMFHHKYKARMILCPFE